MSNQKPLFDAETRERFRFHLLNQVGASRRHRKPFKDYTGMHHSPGELRLPAQGHAESVFAILELILPKRVAAEEIGDALESIQELAAHGRPRWMIYLKVTSTVFWTSINALRELTSSILGRKRA